MIDFETIEYEHCLVRGPHNHTANDDTHLLNVLKTTDNRYYLAYCIYRFKNTDAIIVLIKETTLDAKEAFDDWDARGFLTPTITSVDEANLEVIVHNNNLKQSKTIKTANVANTYSFSDDNRKRYQDYLAERDIAPRKAQFRENLKDAANDDSLWQ